MICPLLLLRNGSCSTGQELCELITNPLNYKLFHSLDFGCCCNCMRVFLSIFPPARTRSLGTTFLNGKIICEKCGFFLLVCLAFQMQPVQLRSPLTYSASTWNIVMCVCVCARAFVIRKYKRISFMLSFWLVEKVDIHIGMKEIEIKTDNNTNNNTKRRQPQRQSPKKKIKIIQNIYKQKRILI